MLLHYWRAFVHFCLYDAWGRTNKQKQRREFAAHTRSRIAMANADEYYGPNAGKKVAMDIPKVGYLENIAVNFAELVDGTDHTSAELEALYIETRPAPISLNPERKGMAVRGLGRFEVGIAPTDGAYGEAEGERYGKRRMNIDARGNVTRYYEVAAPNPAPNVIPDLNESEMEEVQAAFAWNERNRLTACEDAETWVQGANER